MRVLGLDQSFTKSGMVVLEKNDPDMVHAEKVGTSAKDGDDFDRADTIAKRVCQVIDEYKVDKVYIEGLAFGARGDATRKLGGLQFVIITAIRKTKQKPHVEIVSPKTLKKFATGSGNASKEDMINSLDPKIKEIFLDDIGVKKTTGLDDMTDAYYLAEYGMVN